MAGIKLYIVVPCYNEREALPRTAEVLHELLEGMIARGEVSDDSRIMYVDDGSRDGTWELISDLADGSPRVEGIKLAHNAGHQNALWAGMMTAREAGADAAVTIDADLQDDVNVIPKFVSKYLEGCEIVYGVRSSRDTDSGFKRATAQGYYKLLKSMGVDIVYNHADYRLVGRRALDALSEYPERNIFLRGIASQLGFKTASVEYERAERLAGETKYPLKKMISLALEGITSFTISPIRAITLMGAVFALLGVVIAIYALVSRATGQVVAGWTSLMISIWIIGGVQLIALGLIGEYIGRIYMETKRRPRYIIEEHKK